MAEIAELVRRETGIAMPAARESALRGAVDRAARGVDPDDFLRATSDPVRGPGLVGRLIDEVTVHETAFVRSRGQLETIPWHSLLRSASAAGSGTIRVWSAGCASGEEAYTLALLAAEAFAPSRAPVDVLGTDISSAALAAAVAGQYRERAVRGLEAPLRRRYLERRPDGSYLVAERLRRLVRFRHHNLAGGSIPPVGEAHFDIVACRNVLIYFEAPLVERVIESLGRSLRPGGMLLLGAADALQRTVVLSAAQAGRLAAQPRSPQRQLHGGLGRQIRRPLGRQHPQASRERQLAAALDAADDGDKDKALAAVAVLLLDQPFDAEAHFVHGLVMLAAGEPAQAVVALRRALCIDTAFALAAFTLGRCFDVLGNASAAQRSYEQALRMLDPEDHRHDQLLQQVDIGDIAAACLARLGGKL